MIVGVDIGTQSLKVVVTGNDLEGRGEAATKYEPDYPRPGWANQDPAIWERALEPTITKALSVAGAASTDVEALGICGQLDGCVAVDDAGCALSSCIIWMDRRASDEVTELPVAKVRDVTGVVLDPTHMAAKIRWLKHHDPNVARASCFHQPVSYLVARLTGEHVFDHALASTTMLYGLAERGLNSEMLALFEVDPSELPAIADASDCAGVLTSQGATLTGLRPGIPVAVGTGDDFSNPIGAGVISPGRLVCALGTAEVVGALHDSPVIDCGGLVETHGYAAGRFFIENPGWLAGGLLKWCVDAFRLSDFKELDGLASTVCAGADGLTFIPALSGAMAPEWIASARGCYYGLTPSHGTGHLARAALEGCAFAMRDVLERLRELGVVCDSILLLGGGAKSDVWAQIRADLCGLPIEIPLVTDTSPLGAAALASVAAGVHEDLPAAARCLGGELRTLEPNPQHRAAYEDAYAGYRKLFDCLRPMYGQG